MAVMVVLIAKMGKNTLVVSQVVSGYISTSFFCDDNESSRFARSKSLFNDMDVSWLTASNVSVCYLYHLTEVF